MAERVTFRAKSGAEVPGALAFPSGTGPGLVLMQEWWGVTPHIESLVDRFASAGFVVLAPDLYRGVTVPLSDPGEAGRMLGALDWARSMDDIAGAVAYLASHPRVSGKVGIVGFCMGGALALKAGTEVPDIAAVVPFYGIPQGADWSKAKAPILAHVAAHDTWVTVAGAEAVKQAVESHGGSFTLDVYDAQHAFVNDTRPEVYSSSNAKLALDRTIAFLHAQLDPPAAAA